MSTRTALASLSLLFLLPLADAAAQGLLLEDRDSFAFRLPRPHDRFIRPHPRPRPRPTQSYAIKDLSIQARIRDQVATVNVSQTFVNTGKQTMEVSFLFPLPYDGAIDRMTFMVDGKEHEARLLSAKEARRIYESYMRRNLDPALTEWIGSGVFKTSVFPVPAGAKRSVSLRYSQLTRRLDKISEFLYPLSTARYTSKPIESISVDVTLQSQQPIKNVYSPTHEISVHRRTEKLVNVSYEAKSTAPGEDFRLFFDHDAHGVGASVISYRPAADEDGYFLMLATPEIPPADESPHKTVIFAVDRSGSMSGKKMDQAKDALRFVLNHLREGDTFNIIAYDSEIESFAPELQRFSEQTRNEALGFVAGLYAGGSTNINDALKTALAQITDRDRPNYLLFLTDGLPTVGEKNVAKIAQNAREWNEARVRLFTFGVGYDVNSRLLDQLVRENFGQSAFVRPNEDIEQHVSHLARRIETPVLTDVHVKFDVENRSSEHGAVANRMYPSQGFDLFAGEQLVLVGRYSSDGAAKVTIEGKLKGETKRYDYVAKLTSKSNDETHAFVEKLWAMRRVGEIIDEIDLIGRNEELVDELTRLSQRHGIITPYTSFLAEEETNLSDRLSIRAGVREALDELSAESGRSAFMQRQTKGQLRRLSTPIRSDFSEPRLAGQTANRPDEGAWGRSRGLTHVGAKTFYYHQGRWTEAKLLEADVNEATRLVRFSKAYFDLAEEYGDKVSRLLAMDGDIAFEIDGQQYLVVDRPLEDGQR